MTALIPNNDTATGRYLLEVDYLPMQDGAVWADAAQFCYLPWLGAPDATADALLAAAQDYFTERHGAGQDRVTAAKVYDRGADWAPDEAKGPAMTRYFLVHTDEYGEQHQLGGAFDAATPADAIAQMLTDVGGDETADGWEAVEVTDPLDIIPARGDWLQSDDAA